MSLDAGQVFAGYTILRVLGSGGMGRVYLAAHPRLPREDALKVLPPEFTADPQYRERFEREAELAAGLSHPHIVAIHDRGEFEGQFWISMEYVAGTDVARLLRERFPGGMPVDEAMTIIAAVASALDYAHHRGLLHRDVKPANILVTDSHDQGRRIYLADFGIARRVDDAAGLTSTTMAVGTAAYAAPEQLMAGPVDGRADQYALACTAFHLLAGVPPYGGPNLAVVIGQQVSAPPPSIGARRPELAGLDPVFATAMAKAPSGRFGSCGEFAEALRQHLGAPGAHPEPALDPTALALPAKGRLARRPGVVIGIVVGIVLLVAGGAVAGLKLTGQRHPAPASGPFTGTYRTDFGATIALDDIPDSAAPPAVTSTYGIRSVCRAQGCVMTAQRLGGASVGVPTLVFDQIGESWVAVSLGSDTCRDAPAEFWQVFTLRPGPGGSLSGDYTATAANACATKRTVTFTRTADGDINGLPDPAGNPPRVVSPAQALRGRYHVTWTLTSGDPLQQFDTAVTTYCLRTGDRCMSYFHEPSNDLPLVFGDGRWTWNVDATSTCPRSGDTTHMKSGGEYPLPQPPTDPIAKLTGRGHQEQSPPCPLNADFDETFTRTGD
ncbi:serine/threonine-protein kinase [Mycobacterium terramassiliense]|uniref:non-specific serine/threonine protein kinase n=1 Tax=Mycobacterium terramassiliense TaxID=1841859 RepID=A0A2U3N6N3_9MYCO|nr:anchored-membrane serine/threonine-protein kinase [Mycobacterium terramassiliense]